MLAMATRPNSAGLMSRASSVTTRSESRLLVQLLTADQMIPDLALDAVWLPVFVLAVSGVVPGEPRGSPAARIGPEPCPAIAAVESMVPPCIPIPGLVRKNSDGSPARIVVAPRRDGAELLGLTGRRA